MIELTLEQVKGMFEREEFERGMAYYRKDRVRQVRWPLHMSPIGPHCDVCQ